ncbi:hypothetical protein GUITHDRAFT_149205 [Guillardia theta CCMP2712]|uniref:Uncharacterized protein n=1 Tax=Guillardia theta (strain CCMP2712) TaxID=905079 RepID=L1I5P4_GUITC|nr:hypothetical protein GUITHDRAFT_149205 [Guillardia theta CCMP2712]EKX31583.1 hypothetical protein GUITHDRAFT_149205 [Guillardia theta CCMP2712]|eukprot:XP_005818563.1 hypothetical protein GUITHDRAFT_149205 [Guillardia theta CCMP2712]
MHLLQRLSSQEETQADPDDIGNLEELETLIISDNKIASLPPALAALPNLRVLEAERNELEELPRSDGGEGEGEGWAALEVINVANNRIADLSSLSGASKLNTLNADNNKLTEHERIPVTSWSRLKSLSLSGNELEQFPLGVGNLQLLEVIDLQRNRIKSLPAELGDLKDKTLRRLAIEDNPLEDKNRILKILNKGKRPIKEILEYVRKQSAATPSTASSSSSSKKAGKGQEVKEREDEEKEEEGKEEDEEEGKEEEGKVKEKPSKKQEVKKPKKMSRRQEAIWRKMQQEMNEKDKPATEQEEDPEASSSSSSSSAQEVDPAVLLGPSVKYKSEAELMVERGEARDVNHARRMIRDRLGMKNDPDTKHLDRTPASSLPAESKRSLRVKSSSVG